MELNALKDEIQDKAVEAWKQAGKRGTIESITGSGKNFMFLKALYTMPQDNRNTIHVFLAETKERELDFRRDIHKFNEIFDKNVLVDYNLQFFCYQKVYKWNKCEFGLVGCDEIHDQLTPEYVRFHLKNKCEAVLGLSALIKSSEYYTIKRDFELRNFFNKDVLNKHDMLNKIAPICFKYTANQGQEDNTARKLNIYVIEHTLDEFTKNIPAGNRKVPFTQTEIKYYSYLETLFNKALTLEQKDNETLIEFEDRKDKEIRKVAYKRSEFLYNLPSKTYAIKILLNSIKQKTIIFGNSIKSLNDITPDAVISSHNSDEINDDIRSDFEYNKIQTISSFKKLKQGANLPNLDVCIIKDYYSSEVDFIQRIGRLRMNGDKIGHVFIFVTKNTQETVWFNKMIQNCNNYNYILCGSIMRAVEEYKKYI